MLRAQRGDSRAYEELVRPHQEIAFRVAYVITRNAADAEDAAQEALLKAWRALELLERLPEQGREVLACRFLLDLSEDETAGALDIPLGTVKSRSARALERLREAYEPRA